MTCDLKNGNYVKLPMIYTLKESLLDNKRCNRQERGDGQISRARAPRLGGHFDKAGERVKDGCVLQRGGGFISTS